MPIKTITLAPQSWVSRDEPGAALSWVPSQGHANMLAVVDADEAVCQNATGIAAESDWLDASQFTDNATGVAPVFEATARDPVLVVKCNMRTGDSKPALPVLYITDSADPGNPEMLAPFSAVQGAAAWYARNSRFPAGRNIFDVLASARFVASAAFPSRPIGGNDANSIYFACNAISLELTYTHGADLTPSPFDFVDKVAALNAVGESDTLVITGFTGPQAISIAGHATAQYSINGGAFTSAPGTINPGDTLKLHMTAAGTTGTARTCTVTVETRTDTWTLNAGDDVPASIGAPADRTGYIPGLVIPATAIHADSAISWTISGINVPMAFSFSGWPVQYSVGAGNTVWVDGAVPGTVTNNDRINIRLRVPPSPNQTATVTLTYSSGNLTDSVNITTAANGTQFHVDLYPVRAFQAAVGAPILVSGNWTPVRSGPARLLGSILSSTFTGAVYAGKNSNWDAGEWWRREDGAPMDWPVGSVLLGIGYGGRRSHNYQQPVPTAVQSFMGQRTPAGPWADLPGTDSGLSFGAVVILNPTSPGIMPAGWDAATLFDAIKNDGFAIGRRAQTVDSQGFVPSADVWEHHLRIFFKVDHPPEAMVWEG